MSTPLEIGGILSMKLGNTREVAELHTTTGRVLWLHRKQEGSGYYETPPEVAGSGVFCWTGGNHKRVIDVSPSFQRILPKPTYLNPPRV